MEFAVRHHASWTGQTIANLRVRDRDANTSACPVDLLSFGLSSVSQFARMWSPDSVAWIGSTSVRLFPPPPPSPRRGTAASHSTFDHTHVYYTHTVSIQHHALTTRPVNTRRYTCVRVRARVKENLANVGELLGGKTAVYTIGNLS